LGFLSAELFFVNCRHAHAPTEQQKTTGQLPVYYTRRSCISLAWRLPCCALPHAAELKGACPCVRVRWHAETRLLPNAHPRSSYVPYVLNIRELCATMWLCGCRGAVHRSRAGCLLGMLLGWAHTESCHRAWHAPNVLACRSSLVDPRSRTPPSFADPPTHNSPFADRPDRSDVVCHSMSRAPSTALRAADAGSTRRRGSLLPLLPLPNARRLSRHCFLQQTARLLLPPPLYAVSTSALASRKRQSGRRSGRAATVTGSSCRMTGAAAWPPSRAGRALVGGAAVIPCSRSASGR
jgi:hypothetical protein